MTSLYELKGQWMALAQRLAEMDIDADTAHDTLDSSDEQMAIEEKAQGYELVARSFESTMPAIDAEIKRLQELKKSRQKKADMLRDRLLTTMQDMGIERISCPLFEIRRQKNPPAVDVFEPLTVPDRFFVQPAPVIDKTAIKAAIKAGEEVPGVRLVQGETIRVK